MKTIKHGIVLEISHRFTCSYCGCIFELTEDEYCLHRFVNIDFSTMRIVNVDFSYSCPDCGYTIIKKGIPV